MKLKFFTVLFLLTASNAYGAIVSPDNVFVQNDAYSSDFHTRLNRDIAQLTDGVNNIVGAQVDNDSLLEANMADEINPRVRTYEGAACEFVYTGLQPATSANLTSNISAGTAYPRGYRINKTGTTSKTYTSGVATYVDIDQNGDFQYTEVALTNPAPSVYANSIRLARVSTDGGTVNTVTDLRKTSCTNGPFSIIGSLTGEGNLDDMFSKGTEVRTTTPVGTAPQGFARGLNVVYAAGGTTFTVKAGAAYINGKYRANTADTTVPVTADNPALGTSGIDTGSIAANTTYYVYAVADLDAVTAMSFSFSTSASSPNGLTNYRLIGSFKTEGNSQIVSRDMNTVHAIEENEIITSSFRFDGTATPISSTDTMNISGITDNGTGDYTVAFDVDYSSATTPIVVCGSKFDGGTSNTETNTVNSIAAGSVQILTYNMAPSAADSDYVACQVTGDTVR
jgi:hypothetical protein